MRPTLRRTLHSAWTLTLGAVYLLALQVGCVNLRNAQLTPTAAAPCPAWVEFPASRYSNEDSVYLNCTNAVNLENMLARGSDLAQGRGLGPSSGLRESLAVDRYNQGKINSPAAAGGATPTIIMPAAGGSTP